MVSPTFSIDIKYLHTSLADTVSYSLMNEDLLVKPGGHLWKALSHHGISMDGLGRRPQ